MENKENKEDFPKPKKPWKSMKDRWKEEGCPFVLDDNSVKKDVLDKKTK